MAEKEHVAKLNDTVAVVFRELIGVKLRERLGKPAFYTGGKRLLARSPVKRDELTEFVGALDHTIKRFRNERSSSPAGRQPRVA